MEIKNILLSTSLAITSVFAGMTIATGSVQAATTADGSTTAQEEPTSEQVATQATNNSDSTAKTDANGNASDAVAVEASNDTSTESSDVTQSTATIMPATTPTTTTNSTQDKVLTTVKGAAKNVAADVVGNNIVAPVAEGALAKIKPLSNVYAGAAGFVDPTSNALGKVSHDIQDAAIDVVGNLPGGKIPSLLMKLAQPFDLTDNNLGGIYGLLTGENTLIPNAIGNKVSDAIKGTEITTKTTAKTDFSDSYKNKRIDNTVTTTIQSPLFNVFEQPVSRSLQSGSSWFTDIQRVNTKTGATYYRVSTNEYVRASDVQVN